MATFFFVPAEAFKTGLMKLLNVRNEECLTLKWGEEEENRYAEGYNLEFCEVLIERVSENGVPSREWVLEGDFRGLVLGPLRDVVPLPLDKALDGIWAIQGEIDERGFPTSREVFFAAIDCVPF